MANSTYTVRQPLLQSGNREDEEQKHRANSETSTDSDLIPSPTAHHRSVHRSYRLKDCLYNLFCTDVILKFCVCIFFGIIPWKIVRSRTKYKYMFFSLLILTLQWCCFGIYIYCVREFWKHKECMSKDHYTIPNSTVAILLGLASSGAVTFTLTVQYFYKKKHNFNEHDDNMFNRPQLRLVPKVHFNLRSMDAGMDEDSAALHQPRYHASDWLLTNTLLFLGFIAVTFVILTDFKFNIFYDFQGIHDFIKPELPKKCGVNTFEYSLYIIAVSTLYWGCFATVCTCCIFFVMSRNVIRHINYTQKNIIAKSRTTSDLRQRHEALMKYTKAMKQSFSLWFGLHNIFFLLIVAALIYEWLKIFDKNNKRFEKLSENGKRKLLAAQIAGSLLVTYKFAFPFIAASRITAAFTKFYTKLARKCKVENTLDFALLCSQAGFTFLGIRVTTSFALLAVFSSFIGALKLLSLFVIK